MNKTAIVEEAKFLYAIRYGWKIPEQRGCVFWAAAFNQAARNAGLKAILQAGSANFQFRRDDGVSDTHFSYEFDACRGLVKFHKGELPEMHVWSYLKTTDEIVDLSTSYQPAQAKDLCDFDWEAEFQPPPYLWVTREAAKKLRPRFVYRPTELATMFATIFVHMFDSRENKEVGGNITVKANRGYL